MENTIERPNAYALDADETGSIELTDLAAHYTETSGPDEEAGKLDLGAAVAAASTGAAVGGTLGTIVPGIGNAVGGVIGGIVGAGASILGNLFGSKKRSRKVRRAKKTAAPRPPKPLPQWQREAIEAARKNPSDPYLAADALLMSNPKFDYLKAKAAGRLPSQVAAREEGRKRAQEIDAKHGERIRRNLVRFSFEERAIIGAALTAGYGREAQEQIAALRGGQEPPEGTDDLEAQRARMQQEIEDLERRRRALMDEITGMAAPSAAPRHEETITESPDDVGDISNEVSSLDPVFKGTEGPAAATPAEPPKPVVSSSEAPNLDPMLEGTEGPAAATPAEPPKPVVSSNQAPSLDPMFEGTEGPTEATPAERPRPVFHIAQLPMTKESMAKILTYIDGVWALPKRQKMLMAGTLVRGVRDVAGIDAVTGDYVAKPSQTPGGIASILTGDETRAPELLAANPFKAPDNPRWKIPPSFGISYQYVTANTAPEEAAAPTGAPKTAMAASTKDGVRQALTARTYVVTPNTAPFMFAQKVGATAVDPQWWRNLKNANPHKATKDNGGNFVRYWAGEVLNYPDAWPAHPEAVYAVKPGGSAPPPGGVPTGPAVPGFPSVPGLPPAPSVPFPPLPGVPVPIPGQTAPPVPGAPAPQPATPTSPGPFTMPPGHVAVPIGGTSSGASNAPVAGATMDPGVMLRTQGILAFWSRVHPEAVNPNVKDFGTQPEDFSGVNTLRTRATLQYWQMWENARAHANKLRVDGVLDQPTYQALNDYMAGPALTEVPPGTVPYVPKQPTSPYTLPWQSAPGPARHEESAKEAAILIPLGAGVIASLLSF